MSEFKKYVERRQRVEALQFSSIGQVDYIANVLGAEEWDVFVRGGGWEFTMRATIGTKEDAVIRVVNRGDFVTRSGEVISAAEFYQAWEEQK